MANALTINGVEFPMESGSPVRTRVYVGGRGIRSQGGVPRDNSRARTFDYKGKTPLVAGADSEAYRALLEGDGHTLDFEPTAGNPTGLATSRGLMASSYVATPVILGDETEPAKYGSWFLYVDPTAGVTWSLGDDFASGWTAIAWRRISGVWRHCIVSRNAAGGATLVAQDGVVDDGETDWAVQVTGGTLKLQEIDDVVHFDDVAFLPYAVPASWVAGLYAFHASRAFPGLPYVIAGGRGVQRAGGMACMGEVTDFKQEDFGTLLESFDFTLRGVPQ